MRFDFNFFFSVIPKLVVKIPYTMWLGTLAFLIAFVIAIFLEIMYESHNRVLRWIAGIYISYFPLYNAAFHFLLWTSPDV